MDIKGLLLVAARHILIPVARILVRNGVVYGDFDEAARHAFAKAAESVLRENRLAVTQARLSVVTGFTRREVERVLNMAQPSRASDSADWLAAALVLQAWHTKPPFVVLPIGVPLDLDYDAHDTKTTFVELVRTYVPGANPAVVLATLMTSGAVREDDRGRLHAASRTFVTGGLTEPQVKYAARAARRFLDTLDANVQQNSTRTGRFERAVAADKGIPVRLYGDFVGHVRSTMQKTLEQIDEWIMSNAVPEGDEPVMWTGVGMYHWLETRDDLELSFGDVVPDEVGHRSSLSS